MTDTIITDSYRGSLFLMHQAFQSDTASASGYRITSLTRLLGEERSSEERLLLQFRQCLIKVRDDCPVYGAMFDYPAFEQEILTFARQCILYGIHPEDLPADNNSENELRLIIEKAFTLDLPEKQSVLIKDERIREILNQTSVKLLDGAFTDIYHASILKQLEKKFGKKSTEVHPDIVLVRDRTPHQEIEAVAQAVCMENRPCNVILCSPSEQMEVLQDVFGRYGIPFSAIGMPVIPLMYRKFCALAECALYKDAGHLLAALQLNAFPLSFPTDLLPFVQEVLTDMHAPAGMADALRNSGVFKNAADAYEQKELRCAQWFADEEHDLNTLQNAETPAEIVSSAFEIVRNNQIFNDQNGRQEGSSLRTVLQDCLPLLATKEDVLYLIRILKEQKSKVNIIQTDFCTVTDLRHPVDPAEVSYIIGCTGNSWPGFSGSTGLFDELYLQRIKGWPALSERYALWMNQLEWVKKSGTKKVVFSCPENDYEGRQIQLPVDIESSVPLKGRRMLLETEPYRPDFHHIVSETAHQLYIEPGEHITGSVSSIERYFNCPYSWFIQSGLHIRVPDAPTLEASSAGTIQHALLEYAVNRYGKKYAAVSSEEVAGFLHPVFESLKAVHPYERDEIEMMEIRMHASLMHALEWLNEFERHTSFQPAEAELKFLEDFTEHVRLRGTIDRLDRYGNELIRIIDYKSSVHKLSRLRIDAGLQLQLLSYLVIAVRQSGSKPAGAYYFSLQEKNIKNTAMKTTGRGKNKEIAENFLTEEDLDAEKIKNRQLAGWTFTDRLTELDDDGAHIASIKRIHDYPSEAEMTMMILYEYFYDCIAHGEIRVDPVQGACTFCDYRSICRFKGRQRDIMPIAVAGGNNETE